VKEEMQFPNVLPEIAGYAHHPEPHIRTQIITIPFGSAEVWLPGPRSVFCPHQQQEIDMIEETGGNSYAWEFKWNEKAKVKIPASFLEGYPGSITGTVNRQNYMDFLNF
jgi:hypothetical protein